MSNTLRPHGLQHARLVCPELSPGVCSNSCPLSQWCNHLILCPPLSPGVCSNSCPVSQWCNHFTLSLPLLLLPSIFPSIRIFSRELALHIRWPKYWSFSFSISLSNEYSRLISFRINWLDLLAVQGTLKSLLQHHSLKASKSSVLSLLYGTLTSIRDYWKNHSLTIHTFVGKLKYLLFNSCLGLSLEKAIAPHSSTLAWKIQWTQEPGGLQSMGLLRVGHDWATSLSLFTFMHWRRKWQPTPVFLPGESQGWGSLVGCHLWGHTELETTEVT